MQITKDYMKPVTINTCCNFFDIIEKGSGKNASGETYPAKTILQVRFDDVADSVSFKADDGSDAQKLIRSLGMVKRGAILQLTIERSFRIRTMANTNGATWNQIIATDTLIGAEVVSNHLEEIDPDVDLFEENN